MEEEDYNYEIFEPILKPLARIDPITNQDMQKNWREKNKEKQKEYNKKYQETYSRTKEYIEANREKSRLYYQKKKKDEKCKIK